MSIKSRRFYIIHCYSIVCKTEFWFPQGPGSIPRLATFKALRLVKLVDDGETFTASLVLGNVSLTVKPNRLLVDADRVCRGVSERIVASDFRRVGRVSSGGSMGGGRGNIVSLFRAGTLRRSVDWRSSLLSAGQKRSVDIVVEVDGSLSTGVEKVGKSQELDRVVLG